MRDLGQSQGSGSELSSAARLQKWRSMPPESVVAIMMTGARMIPQQPGHISEHFAPERSGGTEHRTAGYPPWPRAITLSFWTWQILFRSEIIPAFFQNNIRCAKLDWASVCVGHMEFRWPQ